MHGMHNAFRDLFLIPLTLGTASGQSWLDETGYSLALMGLCTAALFAALHIRERGQERARAGLAVDLPSDRQSR